MNYRINKETLVYDVNQYTHSFPFPFPWHILLVTGGALPPNVSISFVGGVVIVISVDSELVLPFFIIFTVLFYFVSALCRSGFPQTPAEEPHTQK